MTRTEMMLDQIINQTNCQIWLIIECNALVITIMVTALLQRLNFLLLIIDSLYMLQFINACMSSAGTKVYCWVVLSYRSLFIILYSLMTQR